MVYEGNGLIYELVNDRKVARDVVYASLTAPTVVRCEVWIDDKLWDVVYAGAGGSHSWWTMAGGKLLPPPGLLPGQRLRIIVNNFAAFRIDWHD